MSKATINAIVIAAVGGVLAAVATDWYRSRFISKTPAAPVNQYPWLTGVIR